MHDYTLRSEEYGELNGNYDGYALYNKMEWRRESAAKKQARGLFTEIPFRGFTGWICIYDEDISDPIFTCVSRFVQYSDLNETYPIDLTVSEQSD